MITLWNIGKHGWTTCANVNTLPSKMAQNLSFHIWQTCNKIVHVFIDLFTRLSLLLFRQLTILIAAWQTVKIGKERLSKLPCSLMKGSCISSPTLSRSFLICSDHFSEDSTSKFILKTTVFKIISMYTEQFQKGTII